MGTERIDCHTCERMGRVTVILPDGTLTTATCANCHGEGYIIEHWSEGCAYCAHVAARMMPATPMFEEL